MTDFLCFGGFLRLSAITREIGGMPVLSRARLRASLAAVCSLGLRSVMGINPDSWRKRVGVEPTIRPAKGWIAGFEGREGHRTFFASERIIDVGWDGIQFLRTRPTA